MHVETISPDIEAMLEASVKMFWKRGYDATSLDDVVDAMGVPHEFVEGAFSNKEELYAAATRWYLQNYGRRLLSGFAMHSNCCDAIRVALYECIDVLCDKTESDGCLLSSGLLEISTQDSILTREITDLRNTMVVAITRKLTDCKESLKTGTDIETLARFYAATLQGLASQCKDGAKKEQLYRVVDMSMKVLDSYRIN
ncbi:MULTISPECIES: helix-turn-helix domain-containing protein [unclassified Pseudovibrio]|uniref:TetR/AcrR family transcriptional regulator n=1 Tax=unclassified Pseudovibrio TaxID=2627060 RepID=UPI0007B25718|nr:MULTISPECIES: helix-turn-helix domain-containing protein [unclassified Pseudovibrio]KZL02546.1 HTH-type transcriptional repressor ComR [Pseudovibrio sp. W74]KZL07911.1 HTH-type transcriptional repressor ComR [Pseudovibrio sp. Ad14]KZL24448.1 HTH-type transcriptional repressor ComR [Pseudovibrio sp. Ad37]